MRVLEKRRLPGMSRDQLVVNHRRLPFFERDNLGQCVRWRWDDDLRRARNVFLNIITWTLWTGKIRQCRSVAKVG